MTGSLFIKQALIAAICEHPDQEKFRARAFSGENLSQVMSAFSRPENRLTKEDLFIRDDNGKCIIDTPGFWKNFDLVLGKFHLSGQGLTRADFMRTVDKENSRTLLDSARFNDGLKSVFNAEVWRGRYDDMELLWYKLPLQVRRNLFDQEGYVDLDLKRQILTEGGRAVPEDSLARAGITTKDLFSAFEQRGGYEDILRRLAQAGDHLRRDYLLMPDNAGNTVFFHEHAWERYGDIIKGMQKNGERFEVADLIRQVGTVSNILCRAAEHASLHRVFSPDHWVGRLEDMRALWSHVLPGWKGGSLTPSGFDQAYAEAESRTYAQGFAAEAVMVKSDLLKEVSQAGEKPVLLMGLKSFWAQADKIFDRVDRNGGGLTLEDLRRKSGGLDNSCLMLAAKFGRFDKVLDIALKTGEKVTLDDLLAKDSHGISLLNILAERNELALAFTPQLWAGRLGELDTLWKHVRKNDRSQIDFEQIQVDAEQATLQMWKRNRGFSPPAP